MAEVILIAGCLFQPIVFPNFADLKLPKSGDKITLDKNLMNGNQSRKITAGGSQNTVEKGYLFNSATTVIQIVNFTTDYIGKYTLQVRNGDKIKEKILKVESKEPRLMYKELEVKEFVEDGKKMISCGTFHHLIPEKTPIIWKVNCMTIKIDYTYDEEKGLAIAEAPVLCGKKGSQYFPDPDDKCQYYQCGTGGAIHRKSCGQNTKWDPMAKACKHLDSGEKCKKKPEAKKQPASSGKKPESADGKTVPTTSTTTTETINPTTTPTTETINTTTTPETKRTQGKRSVDNTTTDDPSSNDVSSNDGSVNEDSNNVKDDISDTGNNPNSSKSSNELRQEETLGPCSDDAEDRANVNNPCQYETCVDGDRVTENCHPGQKFDETTKACIMSSEEEQDKCGNGTRFCMDTKDDELRTWRDLKDKCWYYQCEEEEFYHKKCVDGYMWNQTDQSCEEMVFGDDCTGKSTNKLCQDGKFYYEDPENKCRFYHCDEVGQKWLMWCAPGTKWNQGETSCVHMTEGEKCTSDTKAEGVQFSCHIDYGYVDCEHLYLKDSKPDKCSAFERYDRMALATGSGPRISPSRELVVGFVGFFLLIKTQFTRNG